MDIPAQVQALDRATLAGLVRGVLSSHSFELDDWRINPLDFDVLMPTTAGLYRVAGTGRDGKETVAWSLILKIFWAAVGCEALTHPYYWKREWLAYTSGLLDELPGGLAAPCCVGGAEGGGTAWVWLEEVVEADHSSWSFDRYRLAARHLGQFNGAYLVERPLPVAAWLGKDWLRASVGDLAAEVARIKGLVDSDDPLACLALPASLVDRVLQLNAERDSHLDAMDRLPQTLCHRDAKTRQPF